MTVFKGFLTIAKRNLGMMFLYILIFLAISLFFKTHLMILSRPVFNPNLFRLRSLTWTVESWRKVLKITLLLFIT